MALVEVAKHTYCRDCGEIVESTTLNIAKENFDAGLEKFPMKYKLIGDQPHIIVDSTVLNCGNCQ